MLARLHTAASNIE